MNNHNPPIITTNQKSWFHDMCWRWCWLKTRSSYDVGRLMAIVFIRRSSWCWRRLFREGSGRREECATRRLVAILFDRTCRRQGWLIRGWRWCIGRCKNCCGWFLGGSWSGLDAGVILLTIDQKAETHEQTSYNHGKNYRKQSNGEGEVEEVLVHERQTCLDIASLKPSLQPLHNLNCINLILEAPFSAVLFVDSTKASLSECPICTNVLHEPQQCPSKI